MAETILKIGIAGAGLMGRWHADAVKRAGGQVMAVVDQDLNIAKRLVSDYGNAKCFSDIEQMLDQCDFNVLHICTPLSTHKKIAEHAIEAGINLIIEKPLVDTGAETQTLLDMAEKRGVIVCPVHQFIFQDGVHNALKWVSQIGRLVHIEGTICSAGGTGQPPAQLDMIVKDILPHPLALMQVFLPNGISEVDWMASRLGDGEFLATGKASSGTALFISISMNARPTECSFLIAGTEGTIHIDLFHGFAFLESDKVSRAHKIMHPFRLAYQRFSAAAVNLSQRIIRRESAYPGLGSLINLFYSAVRNNRLSPISKMDTIAVAQVRDCLSLRIDSAKRYMKE